VSLPVKNNSSFLSPHWYRFIQIRTTNGLKNKITTKEVFSMQDLALYLGIALIAFVLYRKFATLKNPNVKNISAEEAHQLIKSNKNMIIIDVRTSGEFKSGHIPGAKSIPVNEIDSRINELVKYKDTPVLVHCASGGRSPAAVRVLLKNNFSKVHHMNRGLADWRYDLK
jgi:rhodanese-related sulfurtransferase